MNRDVIEGTGLNEALTKQLATFNQKMAMTIGKVKLAAIEMGAKLAPVVEMLGSVIGWLADKFIGMSGWMKTTIAVVVALVAIIAPLLVVVAVLAGLMGGLAAVGATFAAIFSAIPLAIAAVVGSIVALATVIYKNFGLIVDNYNAVKKAVKGFFGFGGDELDVTGTANVNQASRTDINVGVTSAPGTVEYVKTKTTGNVAGLNVGHTMRESR
jgi:hypothetical protein